MKLANATLILLIAILLLALHVGPGSSSLDSHDIEDDDVHAESAAPSLLRGTSRLLGGAYPSSGKNKGIRMTCNKYPSVCHVKGSAGPDCCKKKCVNVKTDQHNCGMCGYRCGHQETCCNGRCVDTMRDQKHCGGCANKCNKGDVCYYGMCNYA